ncbi:MAG: hypothetical protein CMP36_01415 [Rickettsiales bacterium]|nr:hypothetical protein [Marinovum sp.]MAJ24149.1 hypothetical protein [Rickettsiales bacterium]OUV75674.1 MAG: hypothetical protein CBC91_07140 [Rickettsiales bacterium TMED131]OUV81952.1 MAG: hypothetical protein CBC91_01915 [Rickettsiales bacterium TMED131]|tara:strand:+ start:16915 stop:17148 length:234 start_codon:yes stop_codon:yes gene_type:complete
MSRHLKVRHFQNLVRDINSNAIVNTSTSEYEIYMERKRLRDTEKDKLKDMCREINTLKQELFEIKNILKLMGQNNGS